ncbi:MAG: Peptidoglycan-binding domain 1 protein, partial [Acidobacteria bacterium]|nr:Peptidoglycan-binding domain 1 protein [Acidobacteriota bacterium]
MTARAVMPLDPATWQFSQRALELILRNEGLDQGGWPGGASGITIGRGYDLGYHTADEFQRDWSARLPSVMAQLLRGSIGLKGELAHARAAVLRGRISIARADADAVFLSRELPRTIQLTLDTFPGMRRLPLDAQGALVSLVFNRGTRMTDNDPLLQERREMRAIAEAVTRGDLVAIAKQLRLMKRLWIG